MYEPVSHDLLRTLLDRLDEQGLPELDRAFFTRLGANFYAIHSLFTLLYGHRPDMRDQLATLVDTLARASASRPPSLAQLDQQRERDHTWFLHQKWVGMALYTDGFAGTVDDVNERLDYFGELGVNMLHLMPLLRCPPGASDGGYAVSDFRDIDPRVGSMAQLEALATALRERDMLLVLDVVLNHTSDQHEWAQRARDGQVAYRDYYNTYPDRDIPDQFERTLPEIFPETAPGNFTWDDAMQRWVMTVFHTYQWDLDYTNPAVFIEMLDILLFWANKGADVLRLDAVAFIAKHLGTTSQNQREAHLLLQLFKDCCQVVAPGVLFIAEAIVAPSEITKYFGEDAVVAKECEIAYNATLMALLWDAVATHNVKLLTQGVQNVPDKLDLATWLNYARCHDDIGFGFTDADIAAAGYEPRSHRRFLLDWFTGEHSWSDARGVRFGANAQTGDARIAGSLASLIGLESALESGDEAHVSLAIRRIVLLHAILLSFGGIPLLYYGDELGTLNDWRYRDDPSKSTDTRWLHRPQLTDDDRDNRHTRGSVAERLFTALAHLISVRKTLPAFADHNNRQLISTGDDHMFAYLRTHPDHNRDDILVVANFSDDPQTLDLAQTRLGAGVVHSLSCDRITGRPTVRDGVVTLPGATAVWLSR